MAKKRSSLASQSKVRIEEKNDKVLTEGSVFVETDAVLHDIETTMEEGGYRETKKQEITIDNDEGANAEVFKDKKFKRKKKKKTYEHTTWAHKMRVLGVLLVLGIFSGSGMGVWYFNGYLRARIDYGAYNPADYIQSADETLSANGINAKASDGLLWVSKAQSQGLTPADLTPADNFVLAQHNLSFASTYEINGFGYVDSTGVRQSITSRKKFNGSYYTFESISPSKISFIGDIILCDKYVKNGSIINTYNSNIKEPVKGDWVFLEDNTTKDYEFMNGS